MVGPADVAFYVELATALLPPRRVPAAPVIQPPVIRPPVAPPPGPEPGTWVEQDVVVAATLISNGDENSTLIIPGSALPAGSYTLALVLERSRWDTTMGDPQATYRDAATIPLAW
jgi:hypothetical protein